MKSLLLLLAVMLILALNTVANKKPRTPPVERERSTNIHDDPFNPLGFPI